MIIAASLTSNTTLDVTFDEVVTSTTATDFNDWSLSIGTVTGIEDVNAVPDSVLTLTIAGVTSGQTPTATYTDTLGDITDNSAANNVAVTQTSPAAVDNAPPLTHPDQVRMSPLCRSPSR